MDGALDGDFRIECTAMCYRIESTRRLKSLGRGTLRLSRTALAFEAGREGDQGEERIAPLEVPLDSIDFTYLNLANHLVVVGPHGAVQFKVEGDSPVRWEDYVSAARGATIRQWKVREISYWRRKDGFS